MPAAIADPASAIGSELGAEYAGTGWWGAIYRAPRRHRWYRVIPADDLTGAQRSELVEWRKRPRRPDLAPMVPGDQGDQRQLGGRWFQVVCYDTDGERNLADAIADAKPARRARAAAQALRALPGWRESVRQDVMALPADIVLAHRPLLLPLPDWGPPPLRRVLGEPDRVVYLTPEEARGTSPGNRAADLHALAVAALRCFETLPDIEPGQLLQRAACGVLFTHRARDSRLPGWMHRIAAVQAMLDQFAALTGSTDPGSAVEDPVHLAAAIDAARRVMDPVTAVQSLREADDPHRAVGLAHAIVNSEPSYELLWLAAEIADQDLDDPLEACSLLDQAADLTPRDHEADVERLRVISSLWPFGQPARKAAFSPYTRGQLYKTAQDAFRHLPLSLKREHAHEVALCLIRVGRLEEAHEFAYRWLHDGQTLMWWNFPLMLDYGEALLLLRRLDDAGSVVGAVRTGLARALEIKQKTRSQIHQDGLRLADLERQLYEARNEGGTS